MQTAEEWQLVFWITAAIYAFGVIFFALTVSGDRQPWNDAAIAKSDDTVESGEGDDDQSKSINQEPDAKVTDVRKLSSPGNKEATKESPPTDKKSNQSSPKESPKGDQGDDKESEQSKNPNDQANVEDGEKDATDTQASLKDVRDDDDSTAKQTEPSKPDEGEGTKKE